LATGCLILLMGVFARWAAIEMSRFTGDVLHAAHASVAQAPSGARAVLAAPQNANAMHSQASHATGKYELQPIDVPASRLDEACPPHPRVPAV
jgi:hypothetical protein